MKRTDIKKVLIIGSGPIVIGQAAEFDYAGTQACLALREEGYEVVLVNSNPATIMTDTEIADKVYMEPLTVPYIEEVIKKERPNAIVPGIGGQTGLNLAIELSEKGILDKYGVELLGTDVKSIRMAEDRELFKEMCDSIGEPVIPSEIAYTLEEAVKAAKDIGYPVVVRPAFTLGGTGGGFAENEEELVEIATNGLRLSPVSQVLVEKSVKGYKEIEFEVMRDKEGNVITVCGMENVDPVGVHTGDSIVVAPILTLSPEDLKMLNDSAIKIIKTLEIAGGCNVQFALKPEGKEYYLIEVNPRVSRSSALASKASGYPIARVTAKVAVGMTLPEIEVAGGKASTEPSLDYIVAKFPRFPFDKFTTASNLLGTQMKATGEVMGIGSNLEECFLKSLRSLEVKVNHIYHPKFDNMSVEELFDYIKVFRADNFFAIAELLSRGAAVEEVAKVTMITPYFIESIRKIIDEENALKEAPFSADELIKAKKMGFSDGYIARLWETAEREVSVFRKGQGIKPAFRMVDTLHTGKYIPYFYSSYTGANDSVRTDKKKIVCLGSGPIRIGQGIEFDYSTVHAVKTIKASGYESIIINNNPETVSTDYTTADKLYFEPLTPEDVMNVLDYEGGEGVVTSLGGQTAINLAAPLAAEGVTLLGTSKAAIDKAEDRELFDELLAEIKVPRPVGRTIFDVESGVKAAAEIGYPLLVRPSFVLGGRAMQIVSKESELRIYLTEAVKIGTEHPVLIDKYIKGKEVEVDAIADGESVFVPGIMELVERTGVHSGDSISVYPSFSLTPAVKKVILDYTEKLGLAIGIKGLFNVQYIVDGESVYVIEVNPRSSRTVPFLSKSTGIPVADVATKVILGVSLKEQGYTGYIEKANGYFVKVPVFSFHKLRGLDAYLSPEMKSTGEAIGCGATLKQAFKKAFIAAGVKLRTSGTVLLTLADEDKEEALPLIERFAALGFKFASTGLTTKFLQEKGYATTHLGKISEGSHEVENFIRAGKATYVVNTRAILSGVHEGNGETIRRAAIESAVQMMTALDTVRALLSVLEGERG